MRSHGLGYLSSSESDSDDQLPTRSTTVARRKTARRNPFIESEAGVDGAAICDEDDGDDGDLAGFIVSDDLLF